MIGLCEWCARVYFRLDEIELSGTAPFLWKGHGRTPVELKDPPNFEGLLFQVDVGQDVDAIILRQVQMFFWSSKDDEENSAAGCYDSSAIGFQTFSNPKPSKSFSLTVANSVTPCCRSARASRQSKDLRRAKPGVRRRGQNAS